LVASHQRVSPRVRLSGHATTAAWPRDIARTGATLLAFDEDPLATLVGAEIVAEALARARGLDHDRPRHLTRSVVLAA
jgi:fructoselysine-6-P-deglycase FrlB-like protein